MENNHSILVDEIGYLHIVHTGSDYSLRRVKRQADYSLYATESVARIFPFTFPIVNVIG